MRSCGISSETIGSKEFVGERPREQATWLKLLVWCCTQENGGRIEGAREWGNLRWLITCRVELREVEAKSALFGFDGPDLWVRFYPHDQVRRIKALKKGAKAGGKSTSEAKTEAARKNGRLGGRPRKTQ